MFEGLKYQFPVEQMGQQVKYEIVASQIKYGDKWLSDYFYNFHFIFPYEKAGKKKQSFNLDNANQLGMSTNKHADFIDLSYKDAGVHSRLFMEVTPVEMDIMRKLIAVELGYFDTSYLAPIDAFYQAKDTGDYVALRKKREEMFKVLIPFWVHFRALGFNSEDLKS